MKGFIFAGFLLLSGCSQEFWQRPVDQANAREAEALARIKANTPICTEPRECEGMWSAARNWVSASCGMKIQTMTDSFIETFNSVDGAAACRVTKDPRPEGGYSFQALVNCAGGCEPYALVADFQRTLRSAGDAFKGAK